MGREVVTRRGVTRRLVERGGRARGLLVPGGPHLNGDRPAFSIERSAQASDPHGAIGGADEVFFAGPQQVDRRTAVLVGYVDRLLGLRTVAIAAEATAAVALVEVDVLFRNAGDPGSRIARLLRALVPDPRMDPVVGDKHCRVSRFHPGTREIGRGVGRLDEPAAAREDTVPVS